MKKDPYQVIKHQHVTEKSNVLAGLKNSTSNKSVAACKSPKYVFLVDTNAEKREIATAIEEIYHDKGVKVVKVNTINVKSKQRRVRGRPGRTAAFKKAVVTLAENDSLDNV